MIPDIETDVVDYIIGKVEGEFDGDVTVRNEQTRTPAEFPTVFICEADNSNYLPALDTEGSHHSQVMYDINVYTNYLTENKRMAKTLMRIIDSGMQELGFARLSSQPIEIQGSDASIFRMEARYRAIVNEKKQILRR